MKKAAKVVQEKKVDSSNKKWNALEAVLKRKAKGKDQEVLA